jgi:hypothetical protein
MTEEIEGMDELQRRIDALGDTRKMFGQLGLMAVARAKEIVPRKTGNLGRTIRLGQVTESEVQILAGGQEGVGYAQFVEFGTRPHVIRPRNRKVLAWGASKRLSGNARSGSDMIFAHEVNHPGTAPKPFLIPAAQEVVAKEGIGLLVKAWNEAA